MTAIGADVWDGPLDALLDAARAGRVDLARVSMAALVDACLERIVVDPSLARRADQVALAATLTEMKARLLIPAEAAAAEREAERLRARLETARRGFWRGTGWGGTSSPAARRNGKPRRRSRRERRTSIFSRWCAPTPGCA